MKMASSRVFLPCGLLLAVLVLVAAQVSARELAEEGRLGHESVKEANYGHGYGPGYGKGHGSYNHGRKGYGGGYDKGHGSHGYGGHGHNGHGHGGHHSGHPPEETEDVKN